MSLSPSTLSAIQQAGEGLHSARQAVSDAVQAAAERMVAIVADQPFSPESDRVYAQLRRFARMAHELQAMEDQLRVLYTSAAEMMEPEMPVLVALPGHAARSRPRSVKTDQVTEDAVVKTVSSSASKREKHKKAEKAEKGKPEIPKSLGSNDDKVGSYLKTVLDRRSWKSLTHAVIAQGSGIPLGSVGLALRRLAAAGRLREGSKGAYRLA